MNRIALATAVGLVAVGVGAVAFVALRPPPPQEVTEAPPTPEPPATVPTPPPAPTPPPPIFSDSKDVFRYLQPLAPPAAAFTPDGQRVVVGLDEYRDFVRCEFSGLVWRDVISGAEVKRLDLRKHLAPGSLDRKPGPYGAEQTRLEYRRLLILPTGKVVLAGGIRCLDPLKTEAYVTKHFSPYSSTVFLSPQCYSPSGFVWLIDPDTGNVEKTLLSDRVDLVSDIELTRDGAKLLVRMPLPPRSHNPADDPPFVEVQQWDTATWTREWVKMLDPTDAAKAAAK